jgi:hypothetical protein
MLKKGAGTKELKGGLKLTTATTKMTNQLVSYAIVDTYHTTGWRLFGVTYVFVHAWELNHGAVVIAHIL